MLCNYFLQMMTKKIQISTKPKATKPVAKPMKYVKFCFKDLILTQ